MPGTLISVSGQGGLSRYTGGGTSAGDISRYTGGGGGAPTLISIGRKKKPGGLTGLMNTVGLGGPGHWIAHEAGRTIQNISDMATAIPAGVEQMGVGFYHSPVNELKLIGRNTLTSYGETLHHPFRDPGYSLANILGLAGGVGGVAGRVLEAGRLAEGAGALAPGLRASMDTLKAANEGMSDYEAAVKLGRGASYTRAYREVQNTMSPETASTISKLRAQAASTPYAPEQESFLGKAAQMETDATTGTRWEQQPVGHQLLRTLLYGSPKEERILTTEGHPVLDTLLGTAAGTVQHGWMYSRNPTIRAAQKLVDQAHRTFPDSTESPLWHLLGKPVLGSQARRVSRASAALGRIERNSERKLGDLFQKKWGGVGNPMHMAARIVAEGYTPDELITMHQKFIDSGTLSPKMVQEAQARIPVIQEAAQHLTTETHTLTGGRQVVVSVAKEGEDKLQQYIDEARVLSNKRTTAARLSGLLSEESHFGRAGGPLNFVRFGEVPERLSKLLAQKQSREALLGRADISPETRARQQQRLGVLNDRIAKAKGNMSLSEMQSLPGVDPAHLAQIKILKDITDKGGRLTPEQSDRWQQLVATLPHSTNSIVGDELEELVRKAGLFRVPYEIERHPLRSFGAGAFRAQWKGGKKGPPATFTHPFHAGILQHGGGEMNMAKLLAESYTEAHRYIAFVNNRNRILLGGHKTPESIPPEYRVLMATNDFVKRLPAEQAEAFASGEHDPRDIIGIAKQYEGIRKYTFPDPGLLFKARNYTKDRINQLLHGTSGKFHEVPGYVWVDKRTLGGLDKPNPLLSAMANPIVRGAIHTLDAVNNATKMAVLYLKPAYAIPNMLGNVALNLVQQGFLAPVNLAKSVITWRALPAETRGAIRGIMGEGFSEALKPSGIGGRVTHAGNWLAGKYGTVVDDPFRRASFLHEARIDGFITNEQLTRLTTDERYADQFHNIANRANDEIIQYEALGPGEQAIMRRLIFFYPWVKGSSRYALQSIKEHPVAVSAQAQAGQQGNEMIERIFGKLPSYAEGMIPYGRAHHGLISAGSPASMALYQEPADILKAGAGIFQHDPGGIQNIFGNFAPGDASIISGASLGKISSIPHPSGWSPLHVMANEFYGANPLKLLYEANTGGPARSNSLYPDNSLLDAWLRWGLLGGLAKRTYNLDKSNIISWREHHPPKYVGGGLGGD